jgi:hypothetical protein
LWGQVTRRGKQTCAAALGDTARDNIDHVRAGRQDERPGSQAKQSNIDISDHLSLPYQISNLILVMFFLNAFHILQSFIKSTQNSYL